MGRIRVTDHALVRFLERAGGIDVETVRQQLETGLQRAHSAARSISDSDYLVNVDGLVVVVRGEAVTTVVDAEGARDRARHLVGPKAR